MRKKPGSPEFSPPTIGGASLMVIFAVLCLTVFALLSLTTVRADQRLSTASSEGVSAYYAADCQAQEILARLRQGQLPEGVVEHQGICEYQCPISSTQTLSVAVRLEKDHYTVLRWKAVPTHWESDDNLDVWDGE